MPALFQVLTDVKMTNGGVSGEVKYPRTMMNCHLQLQTGERSNGEIESAKRNTWLERWLIGVPHCLELVCEILIDGTSFPKGIHGHGGWYLFDIV